MTNSAKQKGVFHLAIYLVVLFSYAMSFIGVVFCAIFLWGILLAKEVHIQNGQVYVLGLILFYPLFRIKRYIEREWDFKFRHKLFRER